MAEEKNTPEAEIISPFAKDKKTVSKKPDDKKMRSTHVSTMPPAQNLFGRLIQTMNVANTQNVQSTNPGWDVYAAATRVTAVFDKSGALWSPGMPTADEAFKRFRFPRPLTEEEQAAMDKYSRGTFTTPMPEFMRRHWESVNPFGLGNKERAPKLSGRGLAGFNPLLMKMSEGKVEKVMGEYKRGKLHSGSKTGPKVKSKDQAVAIALSEAREAGEDVPAKKSAKALYTIKENLSMDQEALIEKLAANITAARRKKLPKSDFGLKNKADGKKEKAQSGNYPIDTKGRARAALSYSKRYASPGQQATIKKRVESKYPKMEVSAADHYWDGFFQKCADAGLDAKQAQSLGASIMEMLGGQPGEGPLQMAGRRMMAVPSWIGRNPGKSMMAGMAMPFLAAPMLGAGVMGRMFGGQRAQPQGPGMSEMLQRLLSGRQGFNPGSSQLFRPTA